MGLYCGVMFMMLMMAGCMFQYTSATVHCSPTGLMVCINASDYTGPQWATCLTNSYIQQKSHGKHICTDRGATTCYYQCMIEIFNKGKGAVANYCACTKGTYIRPDSSIPSWCNSPASSSCPWYESCLEKRYQCIGDRTYYAQKYATSFCQLTDSNADKFSLYAKGWINATRNCVQLELVPLMRPTTNKVCSQITGNIYDSYSCCYTGDSKCSSAGAPTVCNLNQSDYWRVFWTTKKSLDVTNTYGTKNFDLLLRTMIKCGKEIINQNGNDVVQVQLNYKAKNITDYMSANMDFFSLYTVYSISRQMKWDNDQLDWFAYNLSKAALRNDSSAGIRILLANKASFGLNTFPSSLTLRQVVQKLVDSVLNGSLFSVMPRGFNMSLTSLDVCVGINCTRVKVTAKAAECRVIGTARCMTLPGAGFKAQWVTCLTSTYIQQISRGREKCPYDKTNCHYRCLSETRNVWNGSSTDDCSCTQGAISVPKQALPSWCYSPNRTECLWYDNCLRKRLTCDSHSANDALKYVQNFCQLHDKRYAGSTTKWMDSVRKCLQIRLVPRIRSYNSASCSLLQGNIFESQACCYTGNIRCNPISSPSICGLLLNDYWRIFWTMKNSLIVSTTTAAQSFDVLLRSFMGCGGELIPHKGNDIAQVQLNMKSPSMTKYMSANMDLLALKTGSSFAKQINWNSNELDWFAYNTAKAELRSGSTASVRILLSNKASFGLNTSYSNVSLEKVVRKLVYAVGNGSVRFAKPYGFNSMSFDSIDACIGIKCSITSLHAKASKGNAIHVSLVLIHVTVLLTISGALQF